MNTICIFLYFILPLSLLASSDAEQQIYKEQRQGLREACSFTDETKSTCFYRSTLSIPGLDPALWRQDSNGNLMLAGLIGCYGALCYNFDHIFPINEIHHQEPNLQTIAPLMSNINNCQAMPSRVNSLKASSNNDELEPLFAFDHETMQLFKANNYRGAKIIETYLVSAEQREYFEGQYQGFLGSTYFISLESLGHGASNETYFGHIKQRNKDLAKYPGNNTSAPVIHLDKIFVP